MFTEHTIDRVSVSKKKNKYVTKTKNSLKLHVLAIEIFV